MNNKIEFLKSLIVLDTETTNLDPTIAEIVEIAGAQFNGNNWEIKSKLFGSIDPIPFAASAKNNISRKMIAGKSTFIESISSVKEMIKWKKCEYYVAHNAPYDQKVLASSFTKAGLADDAAFVASNANWICTFRLAKKLIGFEFGDMQYNLNFLRYKLDLPIDDDVGVHRAAADVLTCSALLDFIVEYGIETNVIDQNDDIGKQLNKICWGPIEVKVWPFGKMKGKEYKDIPNDYFIWALGNMNLLKEGSAEFDYDLAASVASEIERRLT